MSIIIKGVEMPKSCISCFLNFGEKRPEYGLTICCPYSHGAVSWRDKAFENGRLPSCGIVPVPPHGRLIDAKYVRDAIIQEWMDKAGDSHMYKCGMEDAYEVIRNAPTIIPASEEVYASGYDTAGNYHWTGTMTGEHIVPTENGKA